MTVIPPPILDVFREFLNKRDELQRAGLLIFATQGVGHAFVA
jgi:hypothetical protein